MRAASLFSGIGGAELALPEAEWLWCAEIEKFPSAVLDARFGHPNLGDITAPDFIERARSYGPLDILAGGPPCQAFSVAGLRKGMRDPRGLLSLRFIEIAHDLADTVGLRNAVVENVPGWLSHKENAFGCFLGGLVGADDALPNPAGGSWPRSGMVAGPRARAAWRVLDAQYAGLAQRRERVILVADFGNGADPVSVLFERKGLSGGHPPRREKGKGLAATVTASTGDCSKKDAIDGRVVATLDASYGRLQGCSGQDANHGYSHLVPEIAHTLRGEGFDASEDGTGRGTPLVPVAYSIMPMNSGKDYKARETDVAQPIMAGGPVGGNQGGDYICDTIAFSCKDHGADASRDLSPTLRAMGHADSHANAGGQMAVDFDLRGREGGAQFEGPHDTANFRAASGGSSRSYVAERLGVRRLTVTECCRLQGYPDDWTMIEFGSRRTVAEDEAAYLTTKGAHVALDNRGKLRTNSAADGPQYKALGNAWAVNCVRPVALRIKQIQEGM